MTSDGLIAIARTLLSPAMGEPSEEALRRSLSTAYYAAFHCLAAECADLLIGASTDDRSSPPWRQVYRALDHGLAKSKSNNLKVSSTFAKHIADFASMFVSLQGLRHSADYDPFLKLSRQEIVSEIDNVEAVITNFRSCAAKDRRAFCAHVLFRDRN